MDPKKTHSAHITSHTSRTKKRSGGATSREAASLTSASTYGKAAPAESAIGVPLTKGVRSSADWQRIVDAITDPIGVITPDYQLVYANAAYVELLAAGTQQGDKQHFCFESNHARPDHGMRQESDGPCVDCPLPKTVHPNHARVSHAEWPVSSAVLELSAGVHRYNSLDRRVYQRWNYPVLAPYGTKVDYIVEVVKDVTEQEQMRVAATQAEAYRQADQLKAELLGTVSHELRSPIAVIKGYTATLLRHETRLEKEERGEFLQAISGACDRLEVMVDQLLEMSQLETGTLVPQFMLVNLEQLVRDAGSALENRLTRGGFGQHRVELTVTLQEDILPVVQADSRLLRDALDSVLENALNYSPAGGTITVTMRVAGDSLAHAISPGS